MRLLLTGGCGFVGSHAVEHLLRNTNWEIVVLDCLNYAGSLHKLTDIPIDERVKFVWHDLRSPISEFTHRLIGEVDYVWHLAAESHVDRSMDEPEIFFQSNVLGTLHLLEYLRKHQPNLKKYIGFNTDEVFGPAPQGVFFKETDKFYPSNYYSASKAGQWAVDYVAAHAWKMPVLMTHSMNIIGERQDPEKFVPKTIKAILKGEKVVLHGSRELPSSRCWLHARNAADALIFLTEKGERAESYNIVGEEHSCLEVANLISQSINHRDLRDDEIEWVDFHSARPGHDLRYALDGTKLSQMGWKSPYGFQESIAKTVNWYIKNSQWILP